MRLRLDTAVVLTLAASFAQVVHAAQPGSGTVSSGGGPTWTGGPYTVGVPSPAGCGLALNPACDAFALSVDLPAGERFVVAIQSEIAGDDYDLYVYYPDGTLAGSSASDGANEATVIEHTTAKGTGPYKVRVLPYTVTAGSTYKGAATATKKRTIEPENVNTCLEAVPIAVGIPGVTDPGQTVTLSVAVLLDGVSLGDGDLVMQKAAAAYAPLAIDLAVASYESVSFTGTEGSAIIQQAKDHFGGVRPAGADLVYVMTSKDITTDGDTSLAGLADCIGGVRFPYHAFAVGEAVGIEPIPVGPFFLDVDAHPEVAAHELGHLMGAQHHYANCVEGNLSGDATDLSPCTLMFNFVDLESLNFGTLEGLVVRGHAVKFASP